jgi:hypothetical protein
MMSPSSSGWALEQTDLSWSTVTTNCQPDQNGCDPNSNDDAHQQAQRSREEGMRLSGEEKRWSSE